jgi:hypothetical protein
MLRIAATLLGFAVAAFSIGFNTMRYARVWEMTGSAQANEVSPSVTASPSEKPENSVPTQPSPPALPPAGRVEINPIPEAADRIAIDKPSLGEANALPDAHSAAGAETSKPLVPVMPASSSASSGSGVELSPGVRRLPAVERANSDRASRSAAGAFNGSIPVYPTTGM